MCCLFFHEEPMKFQDNILMPHTHKHTHTRTSRNQYVPHFFKVGGITNNKGCLSNCRDAYAQSRHFHMAQMLPRHKAMRPNMVAQSVGCLLHMQVALRLTLASCTFFCGDFSPSSTESRKASCQLLAKECTAKSDEIVHPIHLRTQFPKTVSWNCKR